MRRCQTYRHGNHGMVGRSSTPCAPKYQASNSRGPWRLRHWAIGHRTAARGVEARCTEVERYTSRSCPKLGNQGRSLEHSWSKLGFTGEWPAGRGRRRAALCDERLLFFFNWKHMLPLTKGSRLIAGDQINYKVWCMVQKHVRIIHTPSIGVV
jgi:hypothetical protein